MARNVKPREVTTQPLMIEVSDTMMDLLSALQRTGLYGPSVETAAQRILEMWMFDYVTATADEPIIKPPKDKR